LLFGTFGRTLHPTTRNSRAGKSDLIIKHAARYVANYFPENKGSAFTPAEFLELTRQSLEYYRIAMEEDREVDALEELTKLPTCHSLLEGDKKHKNRDPQSNTGDER
jgi:hypothetical protein